MRPSTSTGTGDGTGCGSSNTTRAVGDSLKPGSSQMLGNGATSDGSPATGPTRPDSSQVRLYLVDANQITSYPTAAEAVKVLSDYCKAGFILGIHIQIAAKGKLFHHERIELD